MPTGTVTFLFTDIEGSTRLWEEYPQAMAGALRRHDVILRHCIETHDGVVFKTIGDAFCAAFASAQCALAAACAAQQTLAAKPSEGGVSLRVRMAIHTGEVEHRDQDYFGLPLSRVSRLLAAGHGGQVLLSDSAQDFTAHLLPAPVSLRDLGEHRLRDLSRSLHVFQMIHPDLQSEFPPLNSLDNPNLLNNLPQHCTSFIGRETEMEAVQALLAKSRLLTLTGSGGSGKTRLSLQVAAELLDEYSDGVWLVELAQLSDPGLVPKAVANALHVREEFGKALTDSVAQALLDKRLLLLLDNCEHLVDSVARFTEALLAQCPAVTVLASSREALGITCEQIFTVPPLRLPSAQRQTAELELEVILASEAVRLFADRAAMRAPEFIITPTIAPVVARICTRLDGIPLAIELAAARVRSLPVEQIELRLSDRFSLLTGGSRTSLPRQQTLRGLIDWSYELLGEPERLLQMRLSVFAGGCSLAAAEAVCCDGEAAARDILDLVTALVDKSLVVYESAGGDARYRLLESVRQYSMERLAINGGSDIYKRRHFDYFKMYAHLAEDKLKGAEQGAWLDRLELEHDNLRAALEFCTNDRELGVQGLALAAALQQFWVTRGYLTEGRQRIQCLLARSDTQGTTLARAAALNGAGRLARMQGDHTAARFLHTESLALYRHLNDEKGIAKALNNLGTVCYFQANYTEARTLYTESQEVSRLCSDAQGVSNSLMNLGNVAYVQADYPAAKLSYEQALQIYEDAGDRQGISSCLNNLGNVLHLQRNLERARHLLERSLGLRRELADRQGVAMSLENLGNVTADQGDLTLAETHYQDALTLFRGLGDRNGIAICLHHLGDAAREKSDLLIARKHYAESLAIKRALDNKHGIAYSLEAFAALSVELKQWERAARLWGAAEKIRTELRAPLPLSERTAYDRAVARARAESTGGAFELSWSEGSKMTLERATEYAVQN